MDSNGELHDTFSLSQFNMPTSSNPIDPAQGTKGWNSEKHKHLPSVKGQELWDWMAGRSDSGKESEAWMCKKNP